jgi:hypothetical protein
MDAAAEEHWRPVAANYEVSDFGRVRNTKTGLVMKQTNDTAGYPQLKIAGERKLVSRLVAIAFIENPDNLPQVEHRDRDPTNNAVTNLRWATGSQNSLNRRRPPRALPRGVNQIANRFQARIKLNGVIEHLGMFSTAEEAHAAFCARAAELPGFEFRRFD